MKKKHGENRGLRESREQRPVMYIGPTIPEVVQEGTVFVNGVSRELDVFIRKSPMAKHFLVTLDEANRKRREVKTKGTGLNILYHRLLNR